MVLFFFIACGGSGVDSGIEADDLFGSLGPCETQDGDGELDFHLGCAGEVCAGQTYGGWVDLLGDPECTASSSSARLECNWGGRVAILDDANDDGLVDYSGERIGYFYVRAPYAGTSVEGLGIGGSPACFVETLGTPSSIDLELIVGSTYYPTRMDWELPDLTVRDGNEDALDGRIDELTVWAP